MSSIAPPQAIGPEAAPQGLRSLLPGSRALAIVVVIAFLCAALLLVVAHNTYFELLGETLFVGMSLLFAYTAAGAWRQTVVPRWIA
ncbi:MAG TPA: hypothetical protein VK996_05960, partial [Ramlibacter sp.]|nr:hypothetical protein [Ramlibacter sp.]